MLMQRYIHPLLIPIALTLGVILPILGKKIVGQLLGYATGHTAARKWLRSKKSCMWVSFLPLYVRLFQWSKIRGSTLRIASG